MFDTHCHLDFPALSSGLVEHLEQAKREGVCAWFLPGCRVDEASRTLGMCERLAAEYPLWMGVGQHPYFAEEVEDMDVLGSALSSAIQRGVYRAVGECGLDGGRDNSSKHQIEVFETHLRVAKEAQLPLVLHQVKLRDEFLRCLSRVGVSEARGVVHGFSGDGAWAKALIRRGFFLGLGAAVTRPARRRLRAAVAELPEASLVLETDAPDQVPSGPSGAARRETGLPSDLVHVLREVARLRGIDTAKLAQATTNNAMRLFGSQPLGA